jgi:diguanylate cyclase (GGDEF)-like protein/PAS domain S-box-containing protein
MKLWSCFKSENRRTTILATGAIFLLVFLLACYAGYQGLYKDHQIDKREQAKRLLMTFEENSTRLFDFADSFLRAGRAYYLEHRSGEAWEHFVSEIKAPHAELFKGIVYIIDRDGWVVYHSETLKEKLSSFGRMSDLDHYQYFLNHPGDSLFVGATRMGRMTGALQYRLARPLFRNGAFDGLIVLTLRPEDLTNLYRGMSLGPHSSVTMMTLEPKLIAREPPPAPEAYGQVIPGIKENYGIDIANQLEGSVFAIGSPFEKDSRRDVFFKRLKDYPVVIMVGIAEQDIDIEMLVVRRNLIALALVVTLAVGIVCTVLLRMDQKNRQLTQAFATNREAAAQLRISAVAFESQEGMLITDASGTILKVNQAFVETTGYSAEDAVGKKPSLLKSHRHNAEFYRQMWDSVLRTGKWQGEIWDRRKSGEEFPKWLTISAVKDEQGTTTHFVGTHFDISERKKAEDKIRELAYFDQLTGLPNRTLLLDRLKQAVAESSRNNTNGALLFIDLDHFKTLNDTLGHDMGDLLLQQVAQRLIACLREGDTAARLGGDEFVVMLKNLSQKPGEAASQAENVGEKILLALNQAYSLGGQEFSSTPSIGVALFGGEHVSRDELIKQADLAMYQAKSAGRNALRFFDQEMQAAVVTRVAMERELRTAVRDHQFVLYFQPQVDTDGRCTGSEALLRWQHPERGLVFPDTFISLAEETGLILPLGHWVLEAACYQLATWASRPALCDLTLAVNVSGQQIRQKGFVEEVVAVLERTGADPRKLKLELTESHLLTEVEDTIAKMAALKDRGVGFALDDFGTGYSSLSYLKRLPLEKLKIDRSFVMDVLTDSNDAAIAKTIVALAKTLGLAVIAEGVETEAQRTFLADNGCHWYQGYLFSRPLPLQAFEEYLEKVESSAAIVS